MTSSGGEATDANDRVFNNFVVPPVPVNVIHKVTEKVPANKEFGVTLR